MKTPLFLCAILLLTTIATWSYGVFRHHFNGKDILEKQIAHLTEDRERERMRTRLAKEEFLTFQSIVARAAPEILKKRGEGQAGYPIRLLASVTQKDKNNAVQAQIALNLFIDGKNAFKEKDYKRAIALFQKVIERYSYLPEAVEAHFLLAESNYQLGNEASTVEAINQMVGLFPDSELTGFALLRLAEILTKQGRSAQAIETYKTVLKSFPYREVASEARIRLSQQEP